MAVEIRSTADYIGNGVKMLTYGGAGTGKTFQIGSLVDSGFNPILLDIEGGLLTLRSKGYDLPYISIHSLDDMASAIDFLDSDEAARFNVICLDSISELSKIILADCKQNTKDGRQAYGLMKDTVLAIVRRLCLIPKHLYVTAQLGKYQDAEGKVYFGADAEGQQIAPQLEYMFSELLVSRAEKDSEGNVIRFLQTITDGQYSAKDRSAMLAPYEHRTIGEILKEICR